MADSILWSEGREIRVPAGALKALTFFQMSIDKNGAVSGAYKNLLSGEVSSISGRVDKKTQRVAWKIGR